MIRVWITAILTGVAAGSAAFGEWPLAASVLAATVVFLITTEGRP